MQETQDRLKAYSFDIEPEQAPCRMRIGRKKLLVQVTQYSWSGYTIGVPKSQWRLFALGKRGTLEFQGNTHKVIFLNRVLQDDGSIFVELERMDDVLKSSISGRKKRNVAGASIRLNQGDSVLSIASCFGLVLILLILPGWGEGWGTSSYLTDGIKTFVAGGCDACRCLLGK